MTNNLRACPAIQIRLAGRTRFSDTTIIRRWFRGFAFGIGVLGLAACGKSGPDLKSQFAADIPNAWQVESFKIEAEDDVGTKVEPQRRYRFRAEVSPKADLYESLGALDEHAILKRIARKGDDALVIGVASSVLRGEEWMSMFSHEQAPNFFAGKPADAHGAKHVIVGSSDYKRLVAAAEASLEKRAEQIGADESRWQTMIGEWNALNQKIQEENRQVLAALNDEQQRIHQEQTVLRNKASQENQAAGQELQAALREKGAEPKKELDVRIAELDKDYRLKVAELQAQGKELQQAAAVQRKQLRDAYNTDISAARKRQSAADFTRYKASADETLRTELAGLEASFRERQAQLREQEAALSSQRRELMAQANAVYQEKISAIRQELDATHRSSRDGISGQLNEAIEALNAELQKKRQEQQSVFRANNEQLAAKRREIDNLGAQIQQSRREGAQQQRFIAELKAMEN